MELLQATRLGQLNRLALVGAGGKTTAMFQMAQEYLTRGVSSVLLTASTHLAVAQLEGADYLYEVKNSEKLATLSDQLPPGKVLLIGPRAENDRVSGLTEAQLDDARKLADVSQLPLLIEADGSRQRPLKAPADHEPPIPGWVDTVVVVAGLSGLGMPLTEQWVHRPENFSYISGLKPGARITLDSLTRVLTSEKGGLKNIPARARRVALLNQASSEDLKAVGANLAKGLLSSGYSAALVSELILPDGTWNIKEERVCMVAEPVAGIVLAAGGSSRLGRPKQLLEWHGEAMVRKVALTALEAGLSPVIVVIGAYRKEVQAVLANIPVQLVYNPDWASGQSTSLAAGLRSLPRDTGASIFLLADQPQAPATLARSLVERHAETLAPIIAPLIDGQRGNPVLFDRQAFPDLLALQGDTGGRALFSRYPVDWLPWHDARLLLDIDKPEDYQNLLASDL